jgi:hypothetical protein
MGIVTLSLFSVLIYSYYDNTVRSNIETAFKQLATQTTGEIIKTYIVWSKSEASPENASLIILSNVSLSYPDKIAGRSYEVQLISSPGIWNVIQNLTISGQEATVKKEVNSGSKILLKTTQRPFVTYEYDIPNIPITLQGSFKSGMNDMLRYVRYNYNGTINDRIMLGEDNIIIGVVDIH